MVLRALEAPYWLCEDSCLHLWMPMRVLDFSWNALRGRAACNTEGQGKGKQALILNDGQTSLVHALMTRDLEIGSGSFYNQGPMAGERLRVTASSHSLEELRALTRLLTSTP